MSVLSSSSNGDLDEAQCYKIPENLNYRSSKQNIEQASDTHGSVTPLLGLKVIVMVRSLILVYFSKAPKFFLGRKNKARE